MIKYWVNLNLQFCLSATSNDVIMQPMRSQSTAECNVHSNCNKVTVMINDYCVEDLLMLTLDDYRLPK